MADLNWDEDRVFKIEKYAHMSNYSEGGLAGLQWLAPGVAPLRLAGFAWFAQDGLYRRMPKSPRHKLSSAVDWLANHTAGGQIHFRTNSRRLGLRVELRAPHDADNLTQISQCGFDCYLGKEAPLRYYNSTRYKFAEPAFECMLCEMLPSEMRTVVLNFPLYQGVNSVHVGVEPGAHVEAPPPYISNKKIVVYGTSLTQGGSANRPGMMYTNILSRRFNYEFINLGFSGSGLAEPEVALTMLDIPDPAVFILDYDSNIRGTPDLIARTPVFYDILRGAFPKVPMLLLSKPPFSTETIHSEVRAYRLGRRDFLKEFVRQRQEKGENITFVDGGDFYGDRFDECTVDGRHATDLGFMKIADGVTPALAKALEGV